MYKYSFVVTTKFSPQIRFVFVIIIKFKTPYHVILLFLYILYLPKTKKFGCVGRGDLTSLFFSKVVKY